MDAISLKSEFRTAWHIAYDDGPEFISTPPRLLSEIALDMLKGKVAYWDHYGWVSSCLTALSGLIIQGEGEAKASVTSYAQWLLEGAPEGVADLYPKLKGYASGEDTNTDIAAPIIKGRIDEGIARLKERRLAKTA